MDQLVYNDFSTNKSFYSFFFSLTTLLRKAVFLLFKKKNHQIFIYLFYIY